MRDVSTPAPPPVPGRRPWDIPPLWFAVALAAMLALHLALPLARLVFWPWRLAGFVPVVGGLALAVAGERCFARAGTAVRPFQPSTALVTAGPFRYTRNPMYLGLLLVLGGVWLLLGTLAPLVVLPMFFWLLHARFVLPEEGLMEHTFGAAYVDYRRRVRRWL